MGSPFYIQGPFATWQLESVANGIKSETTDKWIDLFVDRYLDSVKLSRYSND